MNVDSYEYYIFYHQLSLCHVIIFVYRTFLGCSMKNNTQNHWHQEKAQYKSQTIYYCHVNTDTQWQVQSTSSTAIYTVSIDDQQCQ